MAEKAVCAYCQRRQRCEKAGLPKIFPENRRALREYHLMRMTQSLPNGAGFASEGIRTLELFSIIESQVNANELRAMKR